MRRRKFLRSSGILAVGVTASTHSIVLHASQKFIACDDPDAVNIEGLRRSMNYQPVSDDLKKICQRCVFFGKSDLPGCGYCQIFSGTVGASGSCDSWSQ